MWGALSGPGFSAVMEWESHLSARTPLGSWNSRFPYPTEPRFMSSFCLSSGARLFQHCGRFYSLGTNQTHHLPETTGSAQPPPRSSQGRLVASPRIPHSYGATDGERSQPCCVVSRTRPAARRPAQ